MDHLYERQRRLVASVFYDDDVAKIWFHLGDLRIQGKDLAVVGDLIIADKVKCHANVSAAVLKGREAQYSSDTNILRLSNRITVESLTPLMQSVVLHEGVHAYLDYRKLSKTTFFHNEAAAFVTQALFLRSKRERWPAAARRDSLIVSLEALIDRFRMTGNKAWLEWVHVEPFMRLIQSHPAYLLRGGLKMPWPTKTPADGVAQTQRGPLGTDQAASGGAAPLRGPIGFA